MALRPSARRIAGTCFDGDGCPKRTFALSKHIAMPAQCLSGMVLANFSAGYSNMKSASSGEKALRSRGAR